MMRTQGRGPTVTKEGRATATGFAQVNGASLYYEEQGEGDTLLLAHCAPGDLTLWDPQLEAFARSHRVVRYDARGFGRSTFPPGPFAFHEDLRGLLDVLGIERATIIGLSHGGRTAIDLALSHPDRVRALVVANTGISGSTLRPRPAGLPDVEAALARGEVADAAERMARVWFDGPRDPEQVDARLRTWFIERARGQFELIRQVGEEHATHVDLDPPAIQRLTEIRCPTLIVTSDLDQSGILRLSAQLAASIAAPDTAEVRGAAHIVTLEQPEEFNAEVATFLKDLAVGR